jgi:hypothetical protein
MSVLSFVAQLENPPARVLELEKKTLRRVAPGPGQWAIPSDLWHLQESFGQARSYRSVQVTALAAQLRVATWEAHSAGGLHLRVRARELDSLRRCNDHIERITVWSDWYRRSHIGVLHATVSSLESKGVSASSIKSELAGSAIRPWPPEVRTRIKKGFQRAAASKILAHLRPNAEFRMRHKIERWKLQGPPGRAATRILCRLEKLRTLVTPRVSAACFSTIWNRWVTARRFQRRGLPCNRCVLGCPGHAEDSIEHYSRCAVVWAFAARVMQIDIQHEKRLEAFFLAVPEADDKEFLGRLAILIYITYRATNLARREECNDTTSSYEMMVQLSKEAVRGHAPSMRLLDGRSNGVGRRRQSIRDIGGAAVRPQPRMPQDAHRRRIRSRSRSRARD